MIRVFRCAKGQYRELYQRCIDAGWTVLSVRKHELDDCWLLRCARKEWFGSLPYERQVWVAQNVNWK